MQPEVLETAAAGPLAPAQGVEQFQALFERRATPSLGPLVELRRAALERFLERGLPTQREEPWRFTNLAVLGRTAWQLAAEQAAVDVEALASYLYAGCCPLVVVNGRFRGDLSRLPRGCSVLSLREALVGGSSGVALAQRLGVLAKTDEHRFAALNTALFEDGLVLEVADKTCVEEPIQVLFLTVTGDSPQATFPRLLVHAGRSSELTLVESYATVGGGPALTCAVDELSLGEDATLRYYRVVRESEETVHIATQQTYLARAAMLDSQSIVYGGSLVRSDVGAFLGGEGAHATLDGLYVGRDRQHLDTHLRVDHKSPHCTSHELYKGVLTDRSRAVFNGLLYVHPDAQKTDAKQTNRNLLLSDEALVNSNPQLEIYADDVRCTHGSTTGQLDRDALFYLRSRGLPEAAARSVLTFAFIGELLDELKVPSLRDSVAQALARRLSVEAFDLGAVLATEL